MKNGRKKKQKPPAHFHMIRRQSIKFQISLVKDVRGVVVVEKDWTDRKTDGMKDGQMHTQTDEGHFFSPRLPMSGENEQVPSRHMTS